MRVTEITNVDAFWVANSIKIHICFKHNEKYKIRKREFYQNDHYLPSQVVSHNMINKAFALTN